MRQTPHIQRSVDERPSGRLADYPGLISVVIPAYNEAPTVRRTLAETVEAMDETGATYEIILVEDAEAGQNGPSGWGSGPRGGCRGSGV